MSSRRRRMSKMTPDDYVACLSRNLSGKKMPTKKRRRAVMRAVMRICAKLR